VIANSALLKRYRITSGEENLMILIENEEISKKESLEITS
jgi:hypothetical protein